ncbi:DNA glycosylase [Cytidiella melzeri]|nr:DNA glycosylase [Cytidiella melzeri]
MSISQQATVVQVETKTNGTRKRKTTAGANASGSTKKARANTSSKTNVEDATPAEAATVNQALVPAVLTFSFEDARRHLIEADARFGDIFSRMQCKPFEHLEQLDPFRYDTSLDTLMIRGQQISWLAARSITHKFIRLFDPSLPEKPVDHNKTTDFFPTAHQVTAMDIPTLRTAGLSQRKAEYVLDLASRFADGRLSTHKLLAAQDEELYEMLTEVRGIGRVRSDMFAMFSLRRPDILPVGDLGVQRGLLRWFLARHSSAYTVTLSPLKLAKPSAEEEGTPNTKKQQDTDELPVLGQTSNAAARNEDSEAVDKTVAANNDDDSDTEEESGFLPTPFTPSINKTLNMVPASVEIPSLPAGLTVAELKRRLETKKKIKGAFLTPKEMEELTEPWRPYRSLGIYYMWALAEEPK